MQGTPKSHEARDDIFCLLFLETRQKLTTLHQIHHVLCLLLLGTKQKLTTPHEIHHVLNVDWNGTFRQVLKIISPPSFPNVFWFRSTDQTDKVKKYVCLRWLPANSQSSSLPVSNRMDTISADFSSTISLFLCKLLAAAPITRETTHH